MILQYIVTKDILNIRSKPSDENDDTFRGFLLKGTKVWVYENDVIGVVPKGGESNIWKVEVGSGNVISKDGLSLDFQQYIDERFESSNIKQPVDYNFILNIPEEIKQTCGKDSVIGILDQPISTNIQFNKIVRPLAINSPVPQNGHANFISGIIAANSSNIKGISSLTTILELAIFNKEGRSIPDVDFDKLISCIKSFANTIIINVSRTGLFFNQHQQLQLQGLTNVIFVCSAGSDGKLNNIRSNGCFMLNNSNTITIAVGCVSNHFVVNSGNKFQFDKDLDIILPVLTYVSYHRDGQKFDKDLDATSSYATGVVSAIISLLFSARILNGQSDKIAITNAIKKISKNYTGNDRFLNPIIT